MRIQAEFDSTSTNSGCSTTGGKILATLFFGVFLVIGLGFAVVLVTDFIKDFQSSLWQETRCSILSSTIETNETDNSYRAVVEYRYNIDGRDYTGRRIRYSDAPTESYSRVQEIVLRYPAGAEATCLVNPDDPSQVILEPGSPLRYLTVLFPLLFVAIGGGGIFFVWFGSRMRTSSSTGSITDRSRRGKASSLMLLMGGIFFVVGTAFFAGFFLPMMSGLIAARDWRETPCTIISSTVRSHEGDDSTTYSVDILFEYNWGDRILRADTYDFMNWSSSGFSSKQAIVDSYPPGSKSRCWVDPDRPYRAVLNRTFRWGYLIGLFPLVFTAVGAVLFLVGMKQRRSSSVPKQVFSDRPSTHHYGFDEPPKHGPLILKPATGPVAKFIGIIFFCLLWNGIVSIFVWQLYSDWQSGGGLSWGLALFLTPFVLVGLALVCGVFYFLLALFNPRPTLTLSKSLVRLGDTIDLDWSFSGKASRINDLTVSLEGAESATYRRGTDTLTDTQVFHKDEVARCRNTVEIARGRRQITIPASSMHSFESSNNAITWSIKVHGDIPRWPDVNQEFKIAVEPLPREDFKS